jgi:transposase, IS5 family
MQPRKRKASGSGDLFRARLDQIIDLGHALVRLADEIDWDWIDRELADRFSDTGRPGLETRFMVGLLLLKHVG